VKRRSRAVDKPVKTQRAKAAMPKRGNEPKTVRRRNSSAAGLRKQVALLTRERDEALDAVEEKFKSSRRFRMKPSS
jgi:hypothetical protein